MAQKIKRMRMTAVQQSLILQCGGMDYVGIGITGTFAATLSFYGSTDGINFNPLNVHAYPWLETDMATNYINNYQKTPSGSVTQTLCAPAVGLLAIKVVCTAYVSGSAQLVLAASDDGSYADAFSAPSAIWQTQAQTHAANTITIAANANHGWRLASLIIGINAAATTPSVSVKDSAGTVLWTIDLPTAAGTNDLSLTVRNSNIQCTPNNALIITCPDFGSAVTSDLNVEVHAA